MVMGALGREAELVPSPLREGSVARRCPDISKLRALGYAPTISLPSVCRRSSIGTLATGTFSRPPPERETPSMSDMLSLLESHPVTHCHVYSGNELESLLFLGFVPPVNTMPAVGSVPDAEVRFPLELLRCPVCSLAQIGYEVDQQILFPPHSYPDLERTTAHSARQLPRSRERGQGAARSQSG